MSKSAIYCVNNSTQTLNDGNIVNLGSVLRRFGCNCTATGNGIRIQGAGYYKVNASMIVAPAATATTITITMQKDDVPVPGAVAQIAVGTANEPNTLSLVALVKENCACCDDASNLTFILSGGTADISNFAVVVEKL